MGYLWCISESVVCEPCAGGGEDWAQSEPSGVAEALESRTGPVRGTENTEDAATPATETWPTVL